MNQSGIFLIAIGIGAVLALTIVLRRVFLDLREERRRGLNPRPTQAADPGVRKGEVLAGTHDLSLHLLFGLAYFAAAKLTDFEPLLAATAIYVATNALVFLVSRNFEQGLLLVAWVSRVAIIGTGILALTLQDGTFIKINRTAYFAVLAFWSLVSVVAGKPRLQRFSARESLKDVTPEGWRAATLFSAGFCAAFALLNEFIWRSFSTSFWVGFQVWGWVMAEILILPLSLPLFRKYRFRSGLAAGRATGQVG